MKLLIISPILAKCCQIDSGLHYIDYDSCELVPTHDEYWEYFDSRNSWIVRCNDKSVMVGLGQVVNPYDNDWHLDWIYCCELKSRFDYEQHDVLRWMAEFVG